MLSCKHCRLFKFWIKTAAALVIMLVGLQISGHISAKKVGLVYQEPLTTEQQELKDSFIRHRTLPEVLVSKDGTKLYYDTSSGTATTTKPE